MRPVKSADGSSPESMSATVMPLPVQVLPFNPSVPRSAAGFGVVSVWSRAVRRASTTAAR